MDVNVTLKIKKFIILILLFIYLLLIGTFEAFSNQVDDKNLWTEEFSEKNLSLKATNTWHEFNLDNEELEKENWACIEAITFKSKNPFKLKKIFLKWSGDFINTNNISASLYQKKDNDDLLIPIEKNLICDGAWDKKNQQITFELDEKLIAINKYYLVLTFPKRIKSAIQTGSFVLANIKPLKLVAIK